MANINTNVNFYKVSSLSTFDKDKHTGIFVHLTEDAGGYVSGLYFGGALNWEYLTNDTDVAAIQKKISDKIKTLNTTATVKDVVYTAATDTDGAKLELKGVKETDAIIEQGEGNETVEFAKVATSGSASDIKFDEDESKNIHQDATLQKVMSDVSDLIEQTKKEASVTLSGGDGTTVKADGTEYVLSQDNYTVAKFNIVKDSFVKSGDVVYGTLANDTFTEGTPASDGSNAFIKLVVNTTDGTTASEKDLYIPASALVEYTKADEDTLTYSETAHTISLSDTTKGILAKIDGKVSEIVTNAIGGLDNADNISDEDAGITVRIDQEDGEVHTPVVNIADNKVISGGEANARTLTVGETDDVIKAQAIDEIQDYIEKSIGDKNSGLINSLNKAGNKSTNVAGIQVQIDEVNGIVQTPVVTVDDNDVTSGGTDGNRTLDVESTTNVIKGNAIPAIKDYIDNTDSDWAKAIDGGTSDTDAKTLADLKGLIDDAENNAYEKVENASTTQFVKVGDVTANKQTLSVTTGTFTNGETEKVDGLATVSATETYVNGQFDVVQGVVDGLNKANNASAEVAGVKVEVDQTKGKISAPIVSVTGATITDDLTTADGDKVLKGDAIAKIESYTKSKIKSVNDGAITAMTVSNNDGTDKGISVQINEVKGIVQTPVVTVADNAVDEDTLAPQSTTNVLKGDAVSSIKTYTDTKVGAIDQSVTRITGDTADAITGDTSLKIATTVADAGTDNDHIYTITSSGELNWLEELPQ